MTDTKTRKMTGPERAKHIIKYLTENPDTTPTQYAEAHGMWATTVSACMATLVNEGKLVRQRRGRHYHYRLAKVSGAAADAQAKPPVLLVNPHIVPKLEAKIAELEAWKAAAIERFPDLKPVDPLLKQARMYLARHTHPNSNFEIFSGKHDETPAMLAIVDALRVRRAQPKEQTDA